MPPPLISFSARVVIIRVIRVNKEEIIISAEWRRVAISQLAHLSQRLNHSRHSLSPATAPSRQEAANDLDVNGGGKDKKGGRASPGINVCTDKDIIARNSAFSFFLQISGTGQFDGNLSSRGSQSFFSSLLAYN